MKKIVILSNHHIYTYNLRKEIIQKLIEENFKVYIVLPYGEKVELLKKMGCEFIDLPLDSRGMDPISDLKLLLGYYKIIKNVRPDVVLTYTIKPNIYGGIVCSKLKIPYIANITGLGTAVGNKSLLQKVLVQLYRIAFKDVNCIFFQNKADQEFFMKKKIGIGKHRLIPGSGVNIEHFKLLDYPQVQTIHFVFISRIMKEKGIDEYLAAAEYIKKKYPNTEFHICGFCEKDYEVKLNQMQKKGVVKYHGIISDVRKIIGKAHCIIHPTYYPEGMSNVLLESAACGRPIIASNRAGCREVVDDGINGYLIEQKNYKDLIEKIEKFLNLDYVTKKQMGLAGRKKVEKEFDRQIVIDAYLEEINKI